MNQLKQVGDIFQIQTGDILPADGICIESNNISCDESSMTGESDLIKKSPEQMPFMLCGCKVQTGFGKMVVVAVGMNTQFGILKQTIIASAQKKQQTPLQQKLDQLAKYISYTGIASAAFVLLILLIFWIISGAQNTSQFKAIEFWVKLVNYIIISVSIVVMAVPEGLPLAVTIALAYSMRKMLGDNNLVRILSACETMGGATMICSDKTGTLTQNKMKVTSGYLDGEMITLKQQQQIQKNFEQKDQVVTLLSEAIALDSSADIKETVKNEEDNEKQKQANVEHLGNVTECALLQYIKENEGIDYRNIRAQNVVIQTYPFSSEQKRMRIEDPVRIEVPEAIRLCHDSHIDVIMVTGDKIETAIHIAKECGIYNPSKGIAMEGPQFRSLSEEDQLKILPRLQILARSSPTDKHTLVTLLQKLGHVVAVTGDGTNDAPALSKADVGFAMGITGTEVAKDAADIIITDDNFSSIMKAVMWGRNVYDSIRKFVQFQLTVNISAIAIAVAGAIFSVTPLKAIQILWINMIINTLAALALATERPTKELLKRKPYGKTGSIICPSMWRNILASAIYQSVIIIILLFLWGKEAEFMQQAEYPDLKQTELCSLLQKNDEIIVTELFFPNGLCRHFLLSKGVAIFSKQHFSFIFNTFIFMQVFNWIPSRKCYNELNFFKGLMSNYIFQGIMGFVAAFQVIIMLVPGLRDVFSVISLPGNLWGYSFLFSILIIPFRFFVSLLIPSKDPFQCDEYSQSILSGIS
ncbi:MAG: putative Calcium-transporting ATPase 3, plasma membrane-type [Streblomastix strix]|uniref:Putative Calcium-transporting ATPase 3, plasma membrane-type n=1 Tax=Streblomastix strix TaxID=222440 RepID=A0A5J4WJ57_9EUKA|nr:MAG: putative Calcium-transporting ATPase 3, plasma membrane-type [Streblomastix strix]